MKTILAALVLALSTGFAQAATILFDGFESNRTGSSTTPAGWRVTAGTVDTIGTGYYAWYGPGRYLDMNGSTRTGGRIERTVNLVLGAQYELSFSYGFNRNSGTNEVLGFGVGGFSGSIGPTQFRTVVAPAFNTATYRFTATVGGPTVLYFADIGTTNRDNGGPILDNVHLSAVPVPAAASLLLLALGGLAVAGWRKRA